jgi:hypothetical protein
VSSRLLILLGFLFAGRTVQAQSVTDSPERVWTDTTGKHTVVATLVQIHERDVSLTRKDNGHEITIPIFKLAPEDVRFVEEVKRAIAQRESMKNAAQSLAKLHEAINPIIDLYREPTPKNETSVQTARRQKKHFERLRSETTDREFTLFLEVEDVRKAMTHYDPLFHPATGMESKDQRDQRIEKENSFFEIDVVSKNYPLPLPAKYRIYAGEKANDLSVGSYFRIDCKIGVQKSRIGEFNLKYRDIKFPVSVIAFSIPTHEELAPILNDLKQLTAKPREAKLKPSEITRRDFRREFFRLDGADESSLSVIEREELLNTFGLPTRTENHGFLEYLTYECIDGTVKITVQRNVQAVVPDEMLLIKSIDDF